MEREANEHHGRRERAADDELLGEDDQEFASLEDVGPEPSESPPIDDV
jgi:hypothetical protein